MSRPDAARLWRRPELRATIVVVVLAVAGIIALWPRTPPPSSSAAGGGVSSSGVPQVLTPGPRTAPTPDDAALALLRADAALQRCPAASTGARGASPVAGPLAGITVPCLVRRFVRPGR